MASQKTKPCYFTDVGINSYSTGALSLHSACKVSYFRGQLAGKLKRENSSSPGAMISINLAQDKIPGFLDGIEMVDVSAASVNIACINSPLNCTLSGPEPAIDAIKKQADKDGTFAQKLKTGVAYHSPSMQAIANEYFSALGSLEGADFQDCKARASIPMVSSISGKVVHPAELRSARYWVENMVSPVQFSNAVRLITQEPSSLKIAGITDLLEIGPHPALRRPVQDTIQKVSKDKREILYLNALQRRRPAIQTTMELVGQLFCLGYAISVSAVNQTPTHGPFPTLLADCPEYPFDRSRQYWAESRLSRDYRLRGTIQGETLGMRVSDWNPLRPRWRHFLCIESAPWIEHHKVKLCCETEKD